MTYKKTLLLFFIVLLVAISNKTQAQTNLNYCNILNSLINEDAMVANEKVIFWISLAGFEKSKKIKKIKCGNVSVLILPPIKNVKSFLKKQKNFYLIDIDSVDSVTNNIQGNYSFIKSVKYSSHSKAWIFIGDFEGGGNIVIQPNSQNVIIR